MIWHVVHCHTRSTLTDVSQVLVTPLPGSFSWSGCAVLGSGLAVHDGRHTWYLVFLYIIIQPYTQYWVR